MAAAYTDFDNSDEHEVRLGNRRGGLRMKRGETSSCTKRKNIDVSLAPYNECSTTCALLISCLSEMAAMGIHLTASLTTAETLDSQHRYSSVLPWAVETLSRCHGPRVVSGLLRSCCTDGFCRSMIFLLNEIPAV